ncbi:MAG: adenosylcobinamide-GDP ribazoletransferase [Eubacteriales bacterium]|nr:adenosylcobinamide-GDP ribazoletransferase [Eubacteriales bacterium]
MRRVWNSFLIAFAMFSKIPVPRADWDKENMKYMMCFFPAVGAVAGVLFCAAGVLCVRLGSGSVLRGAVLTLLPVLVTGGIHLDGFLDTADALSSYQPVERKLEILKDSHAGAFAVIMGCAYFTLSLGVFSELDERAWPFMALTFVLSRSLSSLALSTFPKANKSGSLSLFSDAAQKRALFGALAVWIGCAAGLGLWWDWRRALIMLGTAGASYVFYYRLAMKEFGGTTGDVAGFFVQVCELACALTLMLGGKLL